MAYDIIVGRNESDRKKFGEQGIILIGKGYVKMGRTTSLSNRIFLDVVRSHVVLVCGKRGSGKSYTLGAIAEGICNLPEDVSKNIAIVIFDTMGIFWTMKYPNDKDEDLLKQWGFKPEGLDKINIYVPEGYFKTYKEEGIPADYPFSIKPNELTPEDWRLTFGLGENEPLAIAIEKIIFDFQEKGVLEYSIEDITKAIDKDPDIDINTKNAAKNRFKATKGWGLFKEEGTKISDMIQGGKVSVLDLSAYTTGAGGWGVKNLVTGLVAKKLFIERTIERRKEEVEMIHAGYSYIGSEEEYRKTKKPMVWVVLDEAHEFLPEEGKTSATDSLITILREGRQPGVSTLLATQQPGKIHRDVMTQTDLIISHRVTAKPDVEALNAMMQSYMTTTLVAHLNNLPRESGAAVILDDNSERIYPMRVRPRFTWHGGEAPTAITYKKKLDLGL
ncbi:MAG: ATP-binding protein [Nanoarchaeota archaeon]|nr:ATP-binding protein [Nanoarchaeota archaeon]